MFLFSVSAQHNFERMKIYLSERGRREGLRLCMREKVDFTPVWSYSMSQMM